MELHCFFLRAAAIEILELEQFVGTGPANIFEERTPCKTIG
jgi:hypothetical protein